jgi:transposase
MNKSIKPNQYTDEFRESSIKLALESDQPVSKTAEELGINKSTLHTWIHKYQQKGQRPAQKTEPQHLYDELKVLRKDNKRLQQERDILKKAAAYFAKESM